MRAEELRIGNYINIHGGSDKTFHEKEQPRYLGIITSLSDTGVIGYRNIDDMPKYYHNSFEPIPLTKEWLLRFGFSRSIHDGMYFHEEMERVYVHIVSPINIHFGNKLGSIKMIDYVHELQNIFFEITGEELQIVKELPSKDTKK